MSDASFVQVAPDSTGKKIRNLQLNVVQSDGSTSTVQMQVISIADANGNLMDVAVVAGSAMLSMSDSRVLEQLTDINKSLSALVHMMAMEFEQSPEDFEDE